MWHEPNLSTLARESLLAPNKSRAGMIVRTSNAPKPSLVRTASLSAFAVTLASTPFALAGSKPLTPQHVAGLRSVSDAKISPDGRYVAYVLTVPRLPLADEDGPAWAELHVVDRSGVSRPFITGEVNVGSVVWMPDGSGVSFLARRDDDGDRSLYVIPIKGGEARKVLSHDTDITGYTWAPDGKRVAFLATDKPTKEREKRRDRGFDQEGFEEDYLPVRAWIASIDNTEPRPAAPGLTRAESASKQIPTKAMDLPGSPTDVIWSPVGSRLATALAPTPLVDDRLMERKLHVFDADTGAIVSSFANPGKLGKSVWSPDGRHLAFRSAADRNDAAAGRLIVADPADGAMKDVLPSYEGHIRSLAWQDADTIMYIGDEGVWTAFGEIRRDGSGRKVHIPTGKMVLSTLTLSRDGQSAAMLSDSPTHPSEVFMMRHGDSGPRRLTDSNPWLADISLAKQEVIAYTARDGLRLQGVLIHPLDEQPGKRYPLILQVHGGPESHRRNGWLTRYSRAGQVGAARGFAVFYPNYRGSTGRGVEFSKMGQAD